MQGKIKQLLVVMRIWGVSCKILSEHPEGNPQPSLFGCGAASTKVEEKDCLNNCLKVSKTKNNKKEKWKKKKKRWNQET